MDPNTDYKKWLEASPRFNWRLTFDFFLTPEALKAVEFNDYGLACFVKGLQYEIIDKNYQEAFNCYENGAMQLDSLCIFRLHEIYLGNSDFNVEYNEKQTIIHLVYAALLSQFEIFDSKVSFWQKFDGFWKKNPEKTAFITELLLHSPTHYFTATGPLFYKLFSFYNNKNSFMETLPELKALCTDVLKKKFFSILNAIFDFLAYTYNSAYSKIDLEKYVETILDMLTNDLLFDNYFNSYVVHLKLLKAKTKFGFVFQRRLETNCFWVWSFSFLVSMKNHYLGTLLSFGETFEQGCLMLKWKNTASWVNNFIGYCYEKGIGAHKDRRRALELYEKDMAQIQRVLFSRYRKILVLKQKRVLAQNPHYHHYNHHQPQQVGKEDELEVQVNQLKQTLEERLEDTSRMDCYLYYVYGKLYEKIDEDKDTAIEWYRKGVEASTDSCLKNHLLCNESWRMKCKRRFQKLQQKKGMAVDMKNKNQED
jgi:hypothetical protein